MQGPNLDASCLTQPGCGGAADSARWGVARQGRDCEQILGWKGQVLSTSEFDVIRSNRIVLLPDVSDRAALQDVAENPDGLVRR